MTPGTVGPIYICDACSEHILCDLWSFQHNDGVERYPATARLCSDGVSTNSSMIRLSFPDEVADVNHVSHTGNESLAVRLMVPCACRIRTASDYCCPAFLMPNT